MIIHEGHKGRRILKPLVAIYENPANHIILLCRLRYISADKSELI